MKRINVAIIGLGQVGGSVGKALKSKPKKYFITGIDRNPAVLKTALKSKAADEVSPSLNAAKGADAIIICAPVNSIAGIYKALSKIVSPDTIITDAGSVKESVERQLKIASKQKRGGKSAKQRRAIVNSVSPQLPFIGAHPMAGTEKNGIENARADMYKNAKVVITNTDKRLLKQQKAVENIWKDAGGVIVKMPPKKHDELAALTSHLPHIIAFALNKIYKQTEKKNKDINFLTAGSFKSITRVAVSSADMWAPIFQMNSKNIGGYLQNFIKELQIFKKALNSREKLKKEILKTQK
ncbi:MAG: prephenate dehydrogenase/arogenate dehydrogenase family protein [Endomicrobium sp.]|jgi:prephenate dehydrogenase|nr:prephenate dehydrogenase/arogenate dehydrogenase family protein [Endomicrobium sp.]